MKHSRWPAAAKAAARSFLPFTARGLAFTALAAVILLAGMLRSDLAALFWGASFLLYAGYALAASALFRVALRRRASRGADVLAVTLPEAGRSPGEQAEAHITARLPRAFPPGLSVRVSLPLAWHERRIDEVARRLSPGWNEHTLSFTAPWRGTYAGTETVLEVRDLLGFASSRFSVALGESLTVFPSILPAEELVRLMEQADETAVYARRRRRNDELLEVRKYYPGDDVRRLNWKVFAHLNELFLRMGEEVPPPESRILVVLDCTRNPLVPSRMAAEYLDRLVEAASSLMAALAARRVEVMLSTPGVGECRSYGEESLTRMLAALAGIWWTDAPWSPELPSRRGLHVAVFSSPGSPGLERIMRLAREQGWGTSLFLKAADPGSPAPRTGFKDLVFVPPPRGAGAEDKSTGYRGAVLVGRELSALQEALSRDLATYYGSGPRVIHAAEI
jgi:uncharacterized protein (DUF58 family)